MSLSVITNEDLDELKNVFRTEINSLKQEIQLISEPEYKGLEDVASELGFKSKQSASKWLKREQVKGVLWDSNPIRVHWKTFLKELKRRQS